MQPFCAHHLKHITVADLGAEQLEPLPGEIAFEPEIGHHRRGHAAAAQLAARRQLAADQRHELVAIDGLALLVDDDQPVGVAIEGDADVGAFGEHACFTASSAVEPTPALMFSPLGVTPIAITSAPSSQIAEGAT